MQSPVELNRYHVQRLNAAAEEAIQGRQIVIRVDRDGDRSYITWVSRQRHVVAAGSEHGMKLLLPLVRAEFERQIQELKRSAVR